MRSHSKSIVICALLAFLQSCSDDNPGSGGNSTPEEIEAVIRAQLVAATTEFVAMATVSTSPPCTMFESEETGPRQLRRATSDITWQPPSAPSLLQPNPALCKSDFAPVEEGGAGEFIIQVRTLPTRIQNACPDVQVSDAAFELIPLISIERLTAQTHLTVADAQVLLGDAYELNGSPAPSTSDIPIWITGFDP